MIIGLFSLLGYSLGDSIFLHFFLNFPNPPSFKNLFIEGGTAITILETKPIKIYRNPSSGNFSIFTKESSSSIRVQIFDVLGHLVYTDKIANSRIELSNMPKGIYWVQILEGKGIYVEQVVVQ